MYEKHLFKINPVVGIYVYKRIDPCVCMGMVQTPKINISGHTREMWIWPILDLKLGAWPN